MNKKRLMCSLATIMAVPALSVSAWADGEELTGKTAAEVVEQMGLGWNLGNTFDATGGGGSVVYAHEMSWGNPAVTKELIDGVKASGFDTIRIPVTWAQELDDKYNINEAFMERVKTVVDLAIDNDMFVIINVHHEKWVNNVGITKTYENVGYELSAVWSQIADTFADYDQHLIFEGMNEPRDSGESYEWSGTEEGYEAINYLNQVFVNTVRSVDKGHNAERCLMIPGYAASSSAVVMNSVAIPSVNGESAGNIIASVHCYAPYNFCLSDSMKNFDVNDPKCVGEINTIFENIDKIFLSNGIPAVIGETSATAKNNVEARENWAKYMGEKSKAYGVPIVIWDNGSDSNSGGESHAHINREKGVPNYPTVIENLKSGYDSVEYGSGRVTQTEDKGESLVGGSVIWSDAQGRTSKATWDSTYIQLGSSPAYYVDGRDVAVVYTGEGKPKLILDSEAQQVWWMPIDEDEIQELGDKKVAIFKKESIDKVLKDNGIKSYGNLRYFMILAADDNITTYEIALTGSQRSVTFIVNGKTVAVGTELPEEPSFTHMTFGGWYTTKDYQEGTEYTGEAVEEDITVYAKFILDKAALGKTDEKEPDETEEETTAEKEEETTAVEKTTADETTEQNVTESTTAADKAQDNEESSGKGFTISIILAVVAVIMIAFAIIWKKRR